MDRAHAREPPKYSCNVIELIFHPLKRPVWCRESLLLEVLDLHGIEYRYTTPDNISDGATVITNCFLMETPCGDPGHDIAKSIIDKCSVNNHLIFYYPSESYSTLSASYLPTADYASFKGKSAHLICNGNWPMDGFETVHYLTKFFAWALINKFNLARLSTTTHAIDIITKTKKFLYLNGETRPRREELFNLVEATGLLSQALWSNRGGKSNQGIPPEVDWVDPFVHDDFRFYCFYPEHYYATEFSLISETAPEEFFPTDKLFRSLMLGHPFILQGSCGALAEIRKLGFKTYDGILNEEYDKIEGIGSRNIAIVESVKQAVTTDDIIAKTNNINKHNRQHFLSLANEVYSDLLNILISINPNIKINERFNVTENLITKYFL